MDSNSSDQTAKRPVPKPRRNIVVGNPIPAKTDYVNVQFKCDKKINNDNRDEVDNSNSGTTYQNLIENVARINLKEADTPIPVVKPRPVPAPRRAEPNDDSYENVVIRPASSSATLSVRLKPAPKIPDRVVNDTSKEINANADKKSDKPKSSPKTFRSTPSTTPPPKEQSTFYDDSNKSPGSGRDNNFRRSFSGSTYSTDSGDSSHKYKTSSPG